MNPLYCYDDEEGWGRALLDTAIRRGIESHMFNAETAQHVPFGALAFVHMHHAKAHNGRPERRERDKTVVRTLTGRGVQTIPSARNAQLYDDKLAQHRRFEDFMPSTEVIESPAHAGRYLADSPPPLISKAAQGAGSHNVRLVRTIEEARREVDAVFGGPGLALRYGERQRGYLLWQEFHAHNPYDYRVIRVGSKRMVLRRWNRDDVPFASGSGKIDPIRGPGDASPEVLSVLAHAERFFQASGFTWSGIDLIRDAPTADCRWLVLECTVGWTIAGYSDCAMLNRDGTATDQDGDDVWDVLLDEIAAGNMGVTP